MAGGIVEVCTGEAVEEPVRLFDVVLSERKRRAIVRKLAEKAADGDVQATAFLFDRLYGRPGVAKAAVDTADIVRLDVRRLNEEEMQTFARLFEKCVVTDDAAGSATGGTLGRRRVALPARSSSVRARGVGGRLVGQADRGRRGTAL